jgi:hypothetical protein
MCCSTPQLCKAVAPGSLQGLFGLELSIALQGPCKHHLGAMVCTHLHGECSFCIISRAQAVHVHLRSSRLQSACKSLELEVLVLGFQEELSAGCCPFRIWRNLNPTNGLQELSRSEELLLHTTTASVHSPDQVSIAILKEHKGQFPPHGLSLIGPVLFPSKGLVLCNIEDR